jgi:succinate--hydroxymethylglutarate CoA-transferase
MQAEAGHMSLTGEPDGPPVRYGLSIVDLVTGLAAAFALLAGVIGARRTGVAWTSTPRSSMWRCIT